MRILVDSNIFLTLLLKDRGWSEVKTFLDAVYDRGDRIYMSIIQLNEILTPLYRYGLDDKIDVIKEEFSKLKIKFVDVNRRISELAALYRAKYKTIEDRWLSLADALILATAVVSEVQTLYTIDLDFINIDILNIASPIGTIEEWILKYGTERQRRLLKEKRG